MDMVCFDDLRGKKACYNVLIDLNEFDSEMTREQIERILK